MPGNMCAGGALEQAPGMVIVDAIVKYCMIWNILNPSASQKRVAVTGQELQDKCDQNAAALLELLPRVPTTGALESVWGIRCYPALQALRKKDLSPDQIRGLRTLLLEVCLHNYTDESADMTTHDEVLKELMSLLRAHPDGATPPIVAWEYYATIVQLIIAPTTAAPARATLMEILRSQLQRCPYKTINRQEDGGRQGTLNPVVYTIFTPILPRFDFTTTMQFLKLLGPVAGGDIDRPTMAEAKCLLDSKLSGHGRRVLTAVLSQIESDAELCEADVIGIEIPAIERRAFGRQWTILRARILTVERDDIRGVLWPSGPQDTGVVGSAAARPPSSPAGEEATGRAVRRPQAGVAPHVEALETRSAGANSAPAAADAARRPQGMPGGGARGGPPSAVYDAVKSIARMAYYTGKGALLNLPENARDLAVYAEGSTIEAWAVRTYDVALSAWVEIAFKAEEVRRDHPVVAGACAAPACALAFAGRAVYEMEQALCEQLGVGGGGGV